MPWDKGFLPQLQTADCLIAKGRNTNSLLVLALYVLKRDKRFGEALMNSGQVNALHAMTWAVRDLG
ncbi:hypothetical protein [Pseudomonas sp. S1(2024)]|uniref:hypothetical protein n=1 Tax=Pseudomonas sp. S1(2024) TaxID=3390191 RepID=UPI00397AB08D